MRQNSLIEDPLIREAINNIEKRLDRIESIPQIPTDASNAYLVKIINKITNSVKRNR